MTNREYLESLINAGKISEHDREFKKLLRQIMDEKHEGEEAEEAEEQKGSEVTLVTTFQVTEFWNYDDEPPRDYLERVARSAKRKAQRIGVYLGADNVIPLSVQVFQRERK